MSFDQFTTQYQPNYPAQSCTVTQSSQGVGGFTNVSVCPMPTDETTRFVRQAAVDPIGAPTASDFLQTLTTSGNEDGGTVVEANNELGNDGCYIPAGYQSGYMDPYPMLNKVTGTAWPVGTPASGPEGSVVPAGHNQWGPDVVGYAPGPVRYYQQQRPKFGLGLPCGSQIYQQLSYSCAATPTVSEAYKINNSLSSVIDATGIRNCRNSVCSPHYAYQ